MSSDPQDVSAARLQDLKALLLEGGKKSVTWEALSEVICELTVRPVQLAFQKHKDARLALEQRVKELEARPMPKYQGVHRDGDHYTANAMVTKAGGLWFATENTSSMPGTGGAWRLIVKRGEAK